MSNHVHTTNNKEYQLALCETFKNFSAEEKECLKSRAKHAKMTVWQQFQREFRDMWKAMSPEELKAYLEERAEKRSVEQLNYLADLLATQLRSGSSDSRVKALSFCLNDQQLAKAVSVRMGKDLLPPED